MSCVHSDRDDEEEMDSTMMPPHIRNSWAEPKGWDAQPTLLPPQNFCGIIIGGSFRLNMLLREQPHYSVYSVTSLEHPDQDLEARAYTLHGITKALRKYRKKIMNRLVGVIEEFSQWGMTFSVHVPEPPKCQRRCSQAAHSPDFDKDFPPIDAGRANRTAGASTEKAARPGRRLPNKQNTATQETERSRINPNICRSRGPKADERFVAQWQIDMTFYRAIVAWDHSSPLSARVASQRVHYDFRPASKTADGVLRGFNIPAWLDECRSRQPLTDVEEFKGAIREKKQECSFLRRQFQEIRRAIHRVQSPLAMPVLYVEGFTPLALGTLLTGQRALEVIIASSEKELAHLQEQHRKTQRGEMLSSEKPILEIQKIAELKRQQERLLPLTPAWSALEADVGERMGRLRASTEDLDSVIHQWHAREQDRIWDVVKVMSSI